MVHQEEWQGALEILQATNNFQNLQDAYALLHVKNRVLGIIEEPVAIENIDIIERGFAEGWIKPKFLYKELVKQ
jgi:glutamate synthase (NADPH/NADH) small chain